MLGPTGFCIVFLLLSFGSSNSSSASIPPNSKSLFLLRFFFAGVPSASLPLSLFSAFGLVVSGFWCFIFGLPDLPSISGVALLLLLLTSITSTIGICKVSNDDADADAVALLLGLGFGLGVACGIASSSVAMLKLSGFMGVKTLGGLMWCICSVIVGLFCLNTSPYD